MNDPETLGSTSPEAAIENDDNNNECACDHCMHAPVSAQPPTSKKTKKQKKRYEPPQPDANTFTTQQEFLDSLHPISIDDVDGNSRKCPICWKPYDEAADAGFDNSEEPVKLRCDHVFGNKCLKDTFAIPDISNLYLRPLTFSSASRGNTLGQSLRTYSTKHEENFKGDTETFSKMLVDSYRPSKGKQLFGDYWWPIIQDLQHNGRNVKSVTFLDNAVLIDVKSMKAKDPYFQYSSYVPIQPIALTPSSSNMDMTLSQNVPNYSPVPTPQLYHPSQASYMATFGLSSAGLSGLPPATVSPLLHMQNATQFPHTNTFSFAQPHIPSPALEQLVAAASETLTTWKDTLAQQKTQLDKLIATKNKVKGDSGTQPLPEIKKEQLMADQMAQNAASQIANQKRMREIQERMRLEFVEVLVPELVRVYTIFQAECNASTKDPTAIQAAAAVEPPHLIHSSITVHTKDLKNTSYEVASLDREAEMYGFGSDGDEHVADMLTVIITRVICTSCCRINEDDKIMEAPSMLWWRNDGNTPDDCPICHKILFKGGNRKYRPVPMVSEDEEMSDGI
ncbi:hypothetical protein EJ02DRAFT_437199 [Clathrospora elynae]|uniref:Uncharacterized protein n=1 Tax=Clathrospora elynae TaxID=706981 RepID=A0A6A5SFY3_9PLEO|nr:hypothetical protein EJ02DRAFT_437199 [Clathrospora elynae]